MVVLSFFLVEIRAGEPWRRVWLGKAEGYPTDWIELKTRLTELMHQVYVEHGMTEAIISLERHLPGRYTVRQAENYVLKKVPTIKEDEAYFRLEFGPKKKK
jgi:hypothetical protein